MFVETVSRRVRDAVGPVGVRAMRLGRVAGERTIVGCHGILRRLNLTPEDFGIKHQVDERDALALVREWLRQYRRWVAFAPEEVFAAKAGALALMLLSAGIWIGAQAFN